MSEPARFAAESQLGKPLKHAKSRRRVGRRDLAARWGTAEPFQSREHLMSDHAVVSCVVDHPPTDTLPIGRRQRRRVKHPQALMPIR